MGQYPREKIKRNRNEEVLACLLFLFPFVHSLVMLMLGSDQVVFDTAYAPFEFKEIQIKPIKELT